MSGCLGQLFQQSGLHLPQPPTTAELQADPTTPLPPAGGFVNVPLSTFPQSPLLQTGAFVVPHTTTPQATVTTSFRWPLLCRLRDTCSHHSAQSTGIFTASDVYYTEGRGVGTGGPLPSSDHGADLVSTCLQHRSSCSRGYYSSQHVAPPPPPGSSSLAWSLLSEDDDDDASGFSVRPSRVVSTSLSDPSSSPRA
jgi:hypothetical protein